ncbi:MAG: hypothetical protein U0Q22_07045 [Acidimicrobiales bacterium]
MILGGLALVLRRTDTPAGHPGDGVGRGHGGGVGTGPGPATPPMGTPTGTPTFVAPARPTRQPRPAPVVGPLTWCAAIAAAGLMGLLGAVGVRALEPGVVAAVVMIVFGLGLTLSAWRGRARGLILPALAIGLLLAGLGALDVRASVIAEPISVQAASARDLPSSGVLRTTIGSSVLDLRNLRLTSNRTLSIEQTAGELRVVLPTRVTSRTVVTLGTGSATVERPSARISMYDPQVGAAWIRSGIPKAGQPLTNTEWSVSSENGIRHRLVRGRTLLVSHRGTPTLTLRIAMGVGNVRVIDPRWSDVPDSITTPTQLCTVAGGRRGTVAPCGSVPVESQVALCIDDDGGLRDCREIPDESSGGYRTAACRGFAGEQEPCDQVGIDPVGLDAIGQADATVPADPGSADPGSADPSTADPTVPTTVAPTVPPIVPSTVAPLSPSLNVPGA